MDFITQLIMQSAGLVWSTFTHNWPFLLISTLMAVSLSFFFDAQKVSSLLARYQGSGVIGATLLAVGTPLCSCGTTAVVLGMMASSIPWAPVIAFMVSSPLTSPEELIYSAGLFGWPFALAFFFSSIFLGLLGGLAGWYFESRGWLKNQTRFQAPPKKEAAAPACQCSPAPVTPVLRPALATAQNAPACACTTTVQNPAPLVPVSKPAAASPACDCSAAPENPVVKNRLDWIKFLNECRITGQRLLLMFFGFAFIGYFLNGLIPTEWVSAIFGKGSLYSVPLAATLGLPLYINSEASLPLVRALIDGGMSRGAALAFLITGAGTSIGAVTGALTIARWRVIGLVVGTLWAGAIISGYIFNFLLASGIL